MNPYFVAGFIAGEGCFGYNEKNKFVQFVVGVHIRDKNMLLEVQKAIGGGTVRSFSCRPNMVRYQIGGFYQLKEKVIPFLDAYLMDSPTFKKEQYKIWREKIMSYKHQRRRGGGSRVLGNSV